MSSISETLRQQVSVEASHCCEYCRTCQQITNYKEYDFMNMTTLSVGITSDIAERLGGLAQITERSQSRLAAEAIEEYLTIQEWQIQAILEGIEAANRGEGTDIKEVKRVWEEKLANSSH